MTDFFFRAIIITFQKHDNGDNNFLTHMDELTFVRTYVCRYVDLYWTSYLYIRYGTVLFQAYNVLQKLFQNRLNDKDRLAYRKDCCFQE